MKKQIVIILLLGMLFIKPSFAQESDATISAMLSPTPAAVEYQLPYPGLLPDSPLYFFKVARDRIVGFIIPDPLRKAEFNLLQADKRMQAGLLLLQKDKKKSQLAFTTVSKAENYFEEAITKMADAKTQGILVNDFAAKLERASMKHQEVLLEMSTLVSNEEKRGYELIINHQKQMIEKVNREFLQKKATK